MNNRILSFCLKLLGFGSTFLLAACYGPAPTNYRQEEIVMDSDTIAVFGLEDEDIDSTIVTQESINP
ncbi:MAG: hypothetical protein IJV06_01860 [Bacteroidaceae bacterium]|nr:hypothetical protein [Bacteroidaceae bacterium]